MKKRIITVCLIGIILLADGEFAQLSERAPDVLPGTIPEMRNPSFRIARMKKTGRTDPHSPSNPV